MWPRIKMATAASCAVAIVSIGTWFAIRAIAEEAKPVSVTVHELHVVTKSKKYPGLYTIPRTEVTFLIEGNDKRIIGIDTQKTMIESFLDNKGNNLLEEIPGFLQRWGIPKISEDGKAALFSINGGIPPAKGAGSIRIKGALDVVVASRKETEILKNIPLKEGPLDFHGLDISIGKVEKVPQTILDPARKRMAMSVRINIKGKAVMIVDTISIVDRNGNPIPTSTSCGKSSPENKWRKYYFPKEQDVLDIKLDFWKDFSSMTVPFDLEFSLGL